MTLTQKKRSKLAKLAVILSGSAIAAYFIWAFITVYNDSLQWKTSQQQEQLQRDFVKSLKQRSLDCVDNPDDQRCIPKMRELKDAIDPIYGDTKRETDWLMALQLHQSLIKSKSRDRVIYYTYAFGFLDANLKADCGYVELEQCDIPTKLQKYQTEAGINEVRQILRDYLQQNARS